jgi:VIT1/CCC1 family predicted Fe2+/Mn2+ transporter
MSNLNAKAKSIFTALTVFTSVIWAILPFTNLIDTLNHISIVAFLVLGLIFMGIGATGQGMLSKKNKWHYLPQTVSATVGIFLLTLVLMVGTFTIMPGIFS